jgi:hypothetical protein
MPDHVQKREHCSWGIELQPDRLINPFFDRFDVSNNQNLLKLLLQRMEQANYIVAAVLSSEPNTSSRIKSEKG